MTFETLSRANELLAKMKRLRDQRAKITRCQQQLENYKDFSYLLIGMPGSADELNIDGVFEAKEAYRDFLSRLHYVVDAAIKELTFELEQL